MSETDAAAGAVRPTENRKGFWMHDDGTLWRGDAPYMRRDGAIPRASPRLHVEIMETWLATGCLDAVAGWLDGRGTTWVLGLGDPEWTARIEALRAGLAERRAGTAG